MSRHRGHGQHEPAIVNWFTVGISLIIDLACAWAGWTAAVVGLAGRLSGDVWTAALIAVAFGAIGVFVALNALAASPGAWAAGIRWRSRGMPRLALAHSAVLALIQVVLAPAVITLGVISSGLLPGSLPRLEGYPISAVRVRSRPMLEAADRYWARWDR